MLRGEATNTNLIVFGLTQLGPEPKISRTRGEHANHYATDAVQTFWLIDRFWHLTPPSAISWRPVLVVEEVFITFSCEFSAPIIVIYKAGPNPRPIGDRFVQVIR
jgi:hypothetical protein